MENFMYPEYEYDEDVEYADYYDDYDYANFDADDGFEKDEEWDTSTSDSTDGSGGLYDLTYQELLEYCVGPTLSSTAPHLGLLLAWALAFSLAARTFPLPASASHFLSITCGTCAICQMFGWRCLYLLGQVAVGGASVAGCAGLAAARCAISARHRAWIITLVCLAYMLLCELYVVDPTVWHSVRGAQMIILMKIVSYAHDVVGSETTDGDRVCGEFVQTSKDNVGKVYAQTTPSVDDCDTKEALNVHSVAEGDHNDSHTHVKKNIITETSGEQREINNEDSSSTVRRRNQKSTSKTESHISSNEKKSSLTNNTNFTTIDDEIDKSSSKACTVKGHVQAERFSLLGGVSQGLELCGYLLHPGTVVFGPWCSLATYRQTLEPLSWCPWGVVGVTLNLLVSGACLVASTCLVTWVLPDTSSSWVLAYRDALSFRVSHYFVCHLSEASAVLGGLTSVGAVARAQHVELPRSLLAVVTNWNVPMHVFLKKHVFLPMRSASGVWCGVFATYAASALIHGLNAQLCAVLLSLALYTHAEHRLRVKLSKAFDACVLARPCPAECSKHKNNGRSTCGLLINLSLGALCMWHLAYLGVMFDSTPGSASGYSLHHTLNKWGKLNYASHWVVVATYVVTALI